MRCGVYFSKGKEFAYMRIGVVRYCRTCRKPTFRASQSYMEPVSMFEQLRRITALGLVKISLFAAAVLLRARVGLKNAMLV